MEEEIKREKDRKYCNNKHLISIYKEKNE